MDRQVGYKKFFKPSLNKTVIENDLDKTLERSNLMVLHDLAIAASHLTGAPRNDNKGTYKAGFTLAEVLVTLAIIGVVAALALPTLITNIQDYQNKTAFKKFYSDLANANNEILSDYDGTILGKNGSTNQTEWYINNLKTHMPALKQCGWAGGGPLQTAGNCWHANGIVKYFDGTAFPDITTAPALVFKNSAIMMSFTSSSTCIAWGDLCLAFIVDANGHKGPNTVGEDIFYIGIQRSSIRPMGTQYDTGADSMRCEPGYEGRGCAYRVLMGIDY